MQQWGAWGKRVCPFSAIGGVAREQGKRASKKDTRRFLETAKNNLKKGKKCALSRHGEKTPVSK